MGGSTVPTVFYFRGIYTDAKTYAALKEVARIVGDDIYLQPIKGCGSFQGHTVTCDGKTFTLGSTAASASTHTGEGAVDIDCSALSDAQARRVETAMRKVGFAAWFRPKYSPYTGNAYGWQRHCHGLLIGTALSGSALTQVTAYINGWDGLAVAHRDTGTRLYVKVRWATYRAPGAAAPVTASKWKTVTIPRGGTLGAVAALLGVSVAALAAFNGISNPNVVTPGTVVTSPPRGYVVPTAKAATAAPLTAAQVKARADARAKALKAAQAKAAAVKAAKARAAAKALANRTVYRAVLKPTRSNVSVKRLEMMLQRKGFLPYRYVDLYYGTSTKTAVNRYYGALGIKTNRTIPGPVMLRALNLYAR